MIFEICFYLFASLPTDWRHMEVTLKGKMRKFDKKNPIYIYYNASWEKICFSQCVKYIFLGLIYKNFY